MNWRPEGWKVPDLYIGLIDDLTQDAFEAGAEAMLDAIREEIEKVELNEGEIHLALVESRCDPIKTYARYRAITRRVKQKILTLLKEQKKEG